MRIIQKFQLKIRFILSKIEIKMIVILIQMRVQYYKIIQFFYIYQFKIEQKLSSMQRTSKATIFLIQLLQKSHNNQSFRKYLKKNTQKINFEQKNILNLTTQKVLSLYKNLQIKINSLQQTENTKQLLQNGTWLQNQLRIFIYILLSYLFLSKKSLTDMKEQDFNVLHFLFPIKSSDHLQYQVKLLTCLKNTKWVNDQSRLFESIMRQNQQSKKWNYIAKEMFIRSNKKFFKTPKQCRERWLNHVDPRKLKGNWQKSQDRTLLNSVLIIGKKWTLISKQLNETRSQNSVKNRYNSLIKTSKKLYGFDLAEDILIDRLLQDLGLDPIFEEKISQNGIQQNNKNSHQQEQKIIQNAENYKQTVKIEEELGQQHKKINESIQYLSQSFKLDQTNKSTAYNLDLKYIFQFQQDIENLVWNSQSSIQKLDQNFCMKEGNLSFMENEPI